MALPPTDLARRHRWFWHFVRMRQLGRSDTVFRNYDVSVIRATDTDRANFAWAGFRDAGEPLKIAQNRLRHDWYRRLNTMPTDVALSSIMHQFVIWMKIKDGEVRNWPLRPPEDIKAFHDQNERARARPQPGQ